MAPDGRGAAGIIYTAAPDPRALLDALAVVVQRLGIHRLSIGGIHDHRHLARRERVLTVGHVVIVIARPGAGIVLGILVRIAVDPQVELVHAALEFAIASLFNHPLTT